MGTRSHGNVESLLPFDQAAGGLSAEAGFDERKDGLAIEAVAGDGVAIDFDGEIRLAGKLLDARGRRTPGTWAITLRISSPFFFEHFQIVAEQFDGKFSFYAG